MLHQSKAGKHLSRIPLMTPLAVTITPRSHRVAAVCAHELTASRENTEAQ